MPEAMTPTATEKEAVVQNPQQLEKNLNSESPHNKPQNQEIEGLKKGPVSDGKEEEGKKEESKKDATATSSKDTFAELALPEKSFLTAEDLEDIKSFAKEKGLSVEQAKMLIERENLAVAAYVGAQREAMKRERESKWIPSLKSDKDFGGERFQESESAIKDFLSRFDPEGELQKTLEDSGFFHFPPLWKVLARAGRAAAKDKIVPGSGSDVSGGRKLVPDVEVFYGKSMKESR